MRGFFRLHWFWPLAPFFAFLLSSLECSLCCILYARLEEYEMLVFQLSAHRPPGVCSEAFLLACPSPARFGPAFTPRLLCSGRSCCLVYSLVLSSEPFFLLALSSAR